MEKIPLFAISFWIGYWAMMSQQAAFALSPTEGGPFDLRSRVANAMVSYMAYLGNIFWPAHLTISIRILPCFTRTTCSGRPCIFRQLSRPGCCW